MHVSRTPFRVSFFGGGSDLAAFYRRRQGAVLSTTIERHLYISVHPCFEPTQLRLKHAEIETCQHADELRHPLVRECLRLVGIDTGLEIVSTSDIPGGTGLGSSSAFTVGLLHALWTYRGVAVSSRQLAEQACHIEIDILGAPIGKQDQYAVAFGGLNLIEFHCDGTVTVEPLCLPRDVEYALEQRLMVFYTRMQRSASRVLSERPEQVREERAFGIQSEMVELVYAARAALERGDLDRFAALLHETWQRKRELGPGVSNPLIDDAYSSALAAGARGGKLLGAGGGGFLLLYCEEDRQQDVRAALGELHELEFHMSARGSQLLLAGV